jgi:hypothetical protein
MIRPPSPDASGVLVKSGGDQGRPNQPKGLVVESFELQVQFEKLPLPGRFGCGLLPPLLPMEGIGLGDEFSSRTSADVVLDDPSPNASTPSIVFVPFATRPRHRLLFHAIVSCAIPSGREIVTKVGF